MSAWKKDRSVWALSFAIVSMSFAASALGVACTYQRPACAVIDLANDVCKLVQIRYPDGHTEEVPKAEAVGAMRRAGLVR